MQSKGCLQGNKTTFRKTSACLLFCLQTLLVLLNHLLEDGGFVPCRLLSPEPLTVHCHPGHRSLPLHALAKILVWALQNLFGSSWADLAETVGRKWATGSQHWWIRGRRWGAGAWKGPGGSTGVSGHAGEPTTPSAEYLQPLDPTQDLTTGWMASSLSGIKGSPHATQWQHLSSFLPLATFSPALGLTGCCEFILGFLVVRSGPQGWLKGPPTCQSSWP